MLDESSASTGSRTSSHVAMGDTRSIVLALQTLQEKIRKLESDRNFHQDQCERERANHEEYKRDIEVQLDRERKEHRRREGELQDLINRATAERNTLQTTLEESRRDIGSFRSELETLLDRERRDATKRDEKLQSELTQLHAELAKERRNAEAAAEAVKSLKAEKETIESTNRRLEETVQEMVAMNNSLIATSAGRNSGRKSTTSSVGALYVDPTATTLAPQPRGRPASAHAAVNRSGSAHATQTIRTGHYAIPTHSSEMKCSRHESHNTSFESKQYLRRSTPQGRSATPPRSGLMGPPRQPVAAGGSAPHNTSVGGGAAAQAKDERIEALDELYTELQQEHEALNKKYNLVVRKASDPDQEGQGKILSPGQLTAELNSIMSKIDKKTEQMQMVRQSRNKLEKEGRTAGVHRQPKNPKGFEKATRKAALMNELRSLFSRSIQH